MAKYKEYGLNQLCDWFSIEPHSKLELDKDLTPARKNWHPSHSSDARKKEIGGETAFRIHLQKHPNNLLNNEIFKENIGNTIVLLHLQKLIHFFFYFIHDFYFSLARLKLTGFFTAQYQYQAMPYHGHE